MKPSILYITFLVMLAAAAGWSYAVIETCEGATAEEQISEAVTLPYYLDNLIFIMLGVLIVLQYGIMALCLYITKKLRITVT